MGAQASCDDVQTCSHSDPFRYVGITWRETQLNSQIVGFFFPTILKHLGVRGPAGRFESVSGPKKKKKRTKKDRETVLMEKRTGEGEFTMKVPSGRLRKK